VSAAQPSLSVVLLSYNRPAYFRQALASVLAQAGVVIEPIVVDNRSPASGEVEAAARAQPGVRLIAHPSNRGFTGGMNAGIRAATGSYVCLTEDDIVLAPGCLAELVAYMEKHPKVGVAGAVMLNRASGTVRCAGGEQHLGARYVKRILVAKDPDQFRAPFFVSYLPGAFMFVRRDVLNELGGFRDDFFMYHEDNEFCLRVLKAGWRIAVVPTARVEHFEPDAAPAPDWLEYVKLRNFFRLYLLHAPAAALLGFFVRYLLLDALRNAAAGRRRCLWLLRAGLDTLLHSPALLRDRWRCARLPGRVIPGASS
jgi:GT2 family glycosyltransferase